MVMVHFAVFHFAVSDVVYSTLFNNPNASYNPNPNHGKRFSGKRRNMKSRRTIIAAWNLSKDLHMASCHVGFFVPPRNVMWLVRWRHNVLVLFIHASMPVSQNIVNMITWKVFDRFFLQNLHHQWLMGWRWKLHILGPKSRGHSGRKYARNGTLWAEA